MKRLSSKKIIKEIIIPISVVLVVWVSVWGYFGTPNPFYVVASGSMVPNLEVYDMIIIQAHIPIEKIKVGDIIVFDRPSDHGRVIVHRVASIIENEPVTLRTKGDANPASIPGTDFPITEKEYLGKVEQVIPKIGYVTQVLKSPVNYILIAIVVGFFVFREFRNRDKL